MRNHKNDIKLSSLTEGNLSVSRGFLSSVIEFPCWRQRSKGVKKGVKSHVAFKAKTFQCSMSTVILVWHCRHQLRVHPKTEEIKLYDW